MSCEGCSQKFTVFKRKKLCNICLRHFCSHCLSPQLGPSANNSVLARLTDRRHICATCLVLTARPLCRLQLKRLKVKDLQHYLTAQHVSTRGCVEKDDLVNLLIRHVGSCNAAGGGRQENVCNSHSDLTSEHNTPRSCSAAPTGTAPFHAAPTPPPAGSFARQHATPPDSSTTSSSSSGHSRNHSSTASRRPVVRSPDTEEGFEIVELTDDWSGEADDPGPEPLVEEMSESVGGSVSSPTGAKDNTLSSSTTSLGDPTDSSSTSSSSSPVRQPTSSPSTAQEQPQTQLLSCRPADEAGSSDVQQGEPKTLMVPGTITLNTIKTLEELQQLPVKQIKDLLMRNRVDFHGCCERTELVERATRLWLENRESRKALERLGSAEMCKICMDAPIECVMLECGHMATCMSCGKQLNECPLCRQYVIRVVRTFRA